MYDYLIVGSGLFGAVCARELTDAGKKVLVIDKRNHIAGNVYTEKVEDIHVHSSQYLVLSRKRNNLPNRHKHL